MVHSKKAWALGHSTQAAQPSPQAKRLNHLDFHRYGLHKQYATSKAQQEQEQSPLFNNVDLHQHLTGGAAGSAKTRQKRCQQQAHSSLASSLFSVLQQWQQPATASPQQQSGHSEWHEPKQEQQWSRHKRRRTASAWQSYQEESNDSQLANELMTLLHTLSANKATDDEAINATKQLIRDKQGGKHTHAKNPAPKDVSVNSTCNQDSVHRAGANRWKRPHKRRQTQTHRKVTSLVPAEWTLVPKLRPVQEIINDIKLGKSLNANITEVRTKDFSTTVHALA